MTHLCHAHGCNTSCKPEFLMCPKHWRMVPRTYQNLVYKHYQPGQCDLNPAPSEKWHAAADLAIGVVALKEGRIKEETFKLTVKRTEAVLNPGRPVRPHRSGGGQPVNGRPEYLDIPSFLRRGK